VRPGACPRVEPLAQARVFVPGRLFKPDLMFFGKARRIP